jgi:hypothetical protein
MMLFIPVRIHEETLETRLLSLSQMVIRTGLLKIPGLGLSAFEMHLIWSTCSQSTTRGLLPFEFSQMN